MQLYKDCPILTARPTNNDISSVPHYLYGIQDANKKNSAAIWLSLATPLIQSIQNPIIVGGTGFYIRSLLEGLSPIPKIEENIQRRVEEIYQNEIDFLTFVQHIDKDLPKHFTDSQRLKRALAVFLQTGQSITTFWGHKNPPLQFEAHVYIINPGPHLLHQRIDQRFDHMIELGALEEVRPFFNQPPKAYQGIGLALGFKELMTHLEGGCSLTEAANQSKIKTRQYAKRQRTWFRNQIHCDSYIKHIEFIE